MLCNLIALLQVFWPLKALCTTFTHSQTDSRDWLGLLQEHSHIEALNVWSMVLWTVLPSEPQLRFKKSILQNVRCEQMISSQRNTSTFWQRSSFTLVLRVRPDRYHSHTCIISSSTVCFSKSQTIPLKWQEILQKIYGFYVKLSRFKPHHHK